MTWSVLAESLGRLDTRVELKTAGTLDITGDTMTRTTESKTKVLRLKPRSPDEPIQAIRLRRWQ